jgi:RNA polymerase sigma-70 factor (ECF subfamily)
MRGRELQQAFERALKQHEGIVVKVASVYASHPEDRRDLTQEICVQAWRSFAGFDPGRAQFSTWLYRIALNVAISYRRKARPEEAIEPERFEALAGASGIAEPDERVAALQRFIGQLDALHRALVLLYLEDRSYAQIAQILGISETNVATKISRIKQKLRSQMTGATPAGERYGTR